MRCSSSSAHCAGERDGTRSPRISQFTQSSANLVPLLPGRPAPELVDLRDDLRCRRPLAPSAFACAERQLYRWWDIDPGGKYCFDVPVDVRLPLEVRIDDVLVPASTEAGEIVWTFDPVSECVHSPSATSPGAARRFHSRITPHRIVSDAQPHVMASITRASLAMS